MRYLAHLRILLFFANFHEKAQFVKSRRGGSSQWPSESAPPLALCFHPL
jgi:hypothetical protein